MKKQLLNSFACIIAAFAIAGCAHTASTTAQKDGLQVAVKITRDGMLYVAGEPCRISDLAGKLTELKAGQAASVVVRADAGAPYKQLVAVMEACKSAGVEQVNLDVTNKPAKTR